MLLHPHLSFNANYRQPSKVSDPTRSLNLQGLLAVKVNPSNNKHLSTDATGATSRLGRYVADASSLCS